MVYFKPCLFCHYSHLSTRLNFVKWLHAKLDTSDFLNVGLALEDALSE